jgi:SAM-dependent methyltransferase
VLDHLPRVIPSAPGRPDVAGEDHPMRKVTRQVAFEPEGWTPERAAKVAELFDGLAPDWNSRFSEHRLDALHDAFARGDVAQDGLCLEIGSGTGLASPWLAERFHHLVAIDLSMEMLRLAPARAGGRVQADAARLPVRGGSATSVVLINALLFAADVDRVLSPSGTVVWVNTAGDRTPIHLPADDVERALPGRWRGTASEAGWGTWAVLRRA